MLIFFYLQKIYKLNSQYNYSDIKMAISTSLDMTVGDIGNEKFPVGIIYNSDRQAYHQQVVQLQDETLVEKERYMDFRQLLEDFL